MRLRATTGTRSTDLAHHKRLAAALVAFALPMFGFGDIASVSAASCVAAADAAQDLRKEGKLREARVQLAVCSQRTCNSVVRADCEKWLKEVDEQQPSVVIRMVDSRGQDIVKGVRVTVDDAPVELDGTPVPLDPGQRIIKAKAKSGDIAEQTTLLVQGEKARVLVIHFKTEIDQDGTKHESNTPPPPPPPTPTPVIPLVLAGVGVVSLIVFGYLEISAQSAYSDLKETCGATTARCPPSKTDPVKQQFVGAGVALGISVVALGAAAVLYFTRRPAARAATPTSSAAIFRDGALAF